MAKARELVAIKAEAAQFVARARVALEEVTRPDRPHGLLSDDALHARITATAAEATTLAEQVAQQRRHEREEADQIAAIRAQVKTELTGERDRLALALDQAQVAGDRRHDAQEAYQRAQQRVAQLQAALAEKNSGLRALLPSSQRTRLQEQLQEVSQAMTRAAAPRPQPSGSAPEPHKPANAPKHNSARPLPGPPAGHLLTGHPPPRAPARGSAGKRERGGTERSEPAAGAPVRARSSRPKGGAQGGARRAPLDFASSQVSQDVGRAGSDEVTGLEPARCGRGAALGPTKAVGRLPREQDGGRRGPKYGGRLRGPQGHGASLRSPRGLDRRNRRPPYGPPRRPRGPKRGNESTSQRQEDGTVPCASQRGERPPGRSGPGFGARNAILMMIR